MLREFDSLEKTKVRSENFWNNRKDVIGMLEKRDWKCRFFYNAFFGKEQSYDISVSISRADSNPIQFPCFATMINSHERSSLIHYFTACSLMITRKIRVKSRVKYCKLRLYIYKFIYFASRLLWLLIRISRYSVLPRVHCFTKAMFLLI